MRPMPRRTARPLARREPTCFEAKPKPERADSRTRRREVFSTAAGDEIIDAGVPAAALDLRPRDARISGPCARGGEGVRVLLPVVRDGLARRLVRPLVAGGPRAAGRHRVELLPGPRSLFVHRPARARPADGGD